MLERAGLERVGRQDRYLYCRYAEEEDEQA
jgi:hypothetical protein